MLSIYNDTTFIQTPVRGDIFIHWFKRRYLPDLLKIETFNSERFWGETDFLQIISNPMIQGYVATRYNKAIGYVMYEFSDDSIEMLNLAVDPDSRHRGIGRLLIQKLQHQASELNLGLYAYVRESNLPFHKFLKATGFEAIDVWADHFQDEWAGLDRPEVEDAYLFRSRIRANFKQTIEV